MERVSRVDILFQPLLFFSFLLLQRSIKDTTCIKREERNCDCCQRNKSGNSFFKSEIEEHVMDTFHGPYFVSRSNHFATFPSSHHLRFFFPFVMISLTVQAPLILSLIPSLVSSPGIHFTHWTSSFLLTRKNFYIYPRRKGKRRRRRGRVDGRYGDMEVIQGTIRMNNLSSLLVFISLHGYLSLHFVPCFLLYQEIDIWSLL